MQVECYESHRKYTNVKYGKYGNLKWLSRKGKNSPLLDENRQSNGTRNYAAICFLLKQKGELLMEVNCYELHRKYSYVEYDKYGNLK